MEANPQRHRLYSLIIYYESHSLFIFQGLGGKGVFIQLGLERFLDEQWNC